MDKIREYDVTIQAIVTKTIRVEAPNEDEAIDIAHQEFSVLNDGIEEDYEQDTLRINLCEEE